MPACKPDAPPGPLFAPSAGDSARAPDEDRASLMDRAGQEGNGRGLLGRQLRVASRPD